jgi:hypothetical protein
LNPEDATDLFQPTSDFDLSDSVPFGSFSCSSPPLGPIAFDHVNTSFNSTILNSVAQADFSVSVLVPSSENEDDDEDATVMTNAFAEEGKKQEQNDCPLI